MKKVYKFKLYDINSDDYKNTEKYATKEYISRINGAILMHDTEREVDDILIDECGLKIEINHE